MNDEKSRQQGPAPTQQDALKPHEEFIRVVNAQFGISKPIEETKQGRLDKPHDGGTDSGAEDSVAVDAKALIAEENSGALSSKALITKVDKFFHRRKPSWFERIFPRFNAFLSTEAYASSRAPLADIYIKWLKEVEQSHLEDHEKAEKIRSFFKSTVRPTLDDNSKGKINDYFENFFVAIKTVTDFYAKSATGEQSINYFRQLFTGSLFVDSDSVIDPRLPLIVRKQLAKLVQAYIEIDPGFVLELKGHLDGLTGSHEEKIASFFNFFQDSFSQDTDKINALQDIEFKRIEDLEQRHIALYYKAITGEEFSDIKPECNNFKTYCQAVLYDGSPDLAHLEALFNYIYDEKERSKMVERWQYNLQRDLTYYTSPKLENERITTLKCLTKIQSILATLCDYSGVRCHIEESKRFTENPRSRDEFYRKPFSHKVEDPDEPYWQRLITPLDCQKQRLVQFRASGIGDGFSTGLAVNEGAFAGQAMVPVAQPIVGAALSYGVGMVTAAGGFYTNKVIVQPDTEAVAASYLGDSANKEVPTWKVCVLFLVKLLCWMSGFALGAAGFISGFTLAGEIFLLLGISAIPVVGWVIGIFGLICTIPTVYSLLLGGVAADIQSDIYLELSKFFKRNFVFPPCRTPFETFCAIMEILFAVIRCILAPLAIAGIIFLAGMKLFAGQIVLFFSKCLLSGKAVSALSVVLADGHSILWIYFNFKKSLKMLDCLTFRNFVKLVAFSISIAVYFLIPVLPVLAVIVKIVQIIAWPFSKDFSDKCGSWFDFLLQCSCPKWLNDLCNNIPGRSLSGVDNSTSKPPKILHGIYNTSVAVVKFALCLPEIAIRFTAGVVYKITGIVRAPVRFIYNKWTGENIEATPFMGILEPKMTVWFGNLLYEGALWVRSKFNSRSKQNSENSSKHNPAIAIAESRNLTINAGKAAAFENSAGQGSKFAKDGADGLKAALPINNASRQYMAGGAQFGASLAINLAGVEGAVEAGFNSHKLVKESKKVDTGPNSDPDSGGLGESTSISDSNRSSPNSRSTSCSNADLLAGGVYGTAFSNGYKESHSDAESEPLAELSVTCKPILKISEYRELKHKQQEQAKAIVAAMPEKEEVLKSPAIIASRGSITPQALKQAKSKLNAVLLPAPPQTPNVEIQSCTPKENDVKELPINLPCTSFSDSANEIPADPLCTSLEDSANEIPANQLCTPIESDPNAVFANPSCASKGNNIKAVSANLVKLVVKAKCAGLTIPAGTVDIAGYGVLASACLLASESEDPNQCEQQAVPSRYTGNKGPGLFQPRHQNRYDPDQSCKADAVYAQAHAFPQQQAVLVQV